MSGFYWAAAALFVIFAHNSLTRPRRLETDITPFTRGFITCLWLGVAVLLVFAAVRL